MMLPMVLPTMFPMRRSCVLLALLFATAAQAQVEPQPGTAVGGACDGVVFEDTNGNGHRDSGEPGVVGIRLSDGVALATTDETGAYRLPVVEGRTTFLIKPAAYTVGHRADGLPGHWHGMPMPSANTAGRARTPIATADCGDYPLRPLKMSPNRQRELDVLVFADPQVASLKDVGYYERDVVEPLMQATAIDMGHSLGRFHFSGLAADLGISLGDIVDDDLSLYPAINAVTARLGVPWLHVAGNHDLDLEASRDEDSLRTFHRHFGPDTFAWEEHEATFVVLDDVIHQPGRKPAYIGGLRDEQFEFLEAYLPTVDPARLLVIAVHIPLFDTAPGRQTFRSGDRERLFALLREVPHVLLLSGHSHNQQHVYHGAQTNWHGARPLHEYNAGAACGAFWSGVEDAAGVPDATMSDGTPNGYARLRVRAGGEYRLSWHPARLAGDDPAFTGAMALHAPRVLRHGAYPAFGVYANVFMGAADSRVDFRVDEGAWQPMRRVDQPDPRLLAENARDDQAEALRGYGRSPEAEDSTHLWRGTLPTDLAPGEHRVAVRVTDRWQGEQRALITYRLVQAQE